MAAKMTAGALLRMARARSGLSQAELAERVHQHATRIQAAAESAGVNVLGLFGSAARKEDRAESDVDLLIDVPPGVGLFALGRLEAELRELLGAEIDLVPVSGLKPRIRRQVEAELQRL